MRDMPSSKELAICINQKALEHGIVPSALLLECIDQIKINLEVVCETSPRMWKTLNVKGDMVRLRRAQAA